MIVNETSSNRDNLYNKTTAVNDSNSLVLINEIVPDAIAAKMDCNH